MWLHQQWRWQNKQTVFRKSTTSRPTLFNHTTGSVMAALYVKSSDVFERQCTQWTSTDAPPIGKFARRSTVVRPHEGICTRYRGRLDNAESDRRQHRRFSRLVSVNAAQVSVAHVATRCRQSEPRATIANDTRRWLRDDYKGNIGRQRHCPRMALRKAAQTTSAAGVHGQPISAMSWNRLQNDKNLTREKKLRTDDSIRHQTCVRSRILHTHHAHTETSTLCRDLPVKANKNFNYSHDCDRCISSTIQRSSVLSVQPLSRGLYGDRLMTLHKVRTLLTDGRIVLSCSCKRRPRTWQVVRPPLLAGKWRDIKEWN